MGQIFGCTRVKQPKVAVVERYGKFDSVLQPGCHFVPWCYGYGVAGELSLHVQQIQNNYAARTKDNVSVTVNIMIQYRLDKNIEDAFYKLKDADARNKLIQAHVLSVVSDIVLKLDLATASEPEQKILIRRDVQARLEKVMSDYGCELVETFVTNIWPDATTVMKAMNETAAAKIRRGGKTTEEDAWSKV